MIPPGHQVCVSPTTNHVLPDTWEDPEKFNPYRLKDYALLNIILKMLHIIDLEILENLDG